MRLFQNTFYAPRKGTLCNLSISPHNHIRLRPHLHFAVFLRMFCYLLYAHVHPSQIGAWLSGRALTISAKGTDNAKIKIISKMCNVSKTHVFHQVRFQIPQIDNTVKTTTCQDGAIR